MLIDVNEVTVEGIKKSGLTNPLSMDGHDDLATVCVVMIEVVLAMLFLALVLTCMRWEHQDVMMGVV